EWRLVRASGPGPKMDEFECVKMARYPFDDLPHGRAMAGPDVVGSSRLRRFEQAYEQVGDIGRIDEVSNLTAVGDVDRSAGAQRRQQRWNEAPRLVAWAIRQEYAAPCSGKTIVPGISFGSHPKCCFTLSVKRSRADRGLILDTAISHRFVFSATTGADETPPALL